MSSIFDRDRDDERGRTSFGLGSIQLDSKHLKNPAIGLVLLAIGVFMGIWAGSRLAKERASLDWETVEGVIVDSDVSRSMIQTRRRRGTRRRDSYKVTVRYEYTVDGKTYTGNRIGFGGSPTRSSRSRASSLRSSEYAEGTTVTVHYDPKNPEKSVLYPGVSMLSYILLGVAVVLALAGAASLGFAFFTTKEPDREEPVSSTPLSLNRSG
jgi:hypothetical protein